MLVGSSTVGGDLDVGVIEGGTVAVGVAEALKAFGHVSVPSQSRSHR